VRWISTPRKRGNRRGNPRRPAGGATGQRLTPKITRYSKPVAPLGRARASKALCGWAATLRKLCAAAPGAKGVFGDIPHESRRHRDRNRIRPVSSVANPRKNPLNRPKKRITPVQITPGHFASFGVKSADRICNSTPDLAIAGQATDHTQPARGQQIPRRETPCPSSGARTPAPEDARAGPWDGADRSSRNIRTEQEICTLPPLARRATGCVAGALFNVHGYIPVALITSRGSWL